MKAVAVQVGSDISHAVARHPKTFRCRACVGYFSYSSFRNTASRQQTAAAASGRNRHEFAKLADWPLSLSLSLASLSLHNLYMHVSLCMYIYIYMCVYIYIYIYICRYVCVYIYIYIHTCMCVYVMYVCNYTSVKRFWHIA